MHTTPFSSIRSTLRRLVLKSYSVEQELEEAVDLFGDTFETTALVKNVRARLNALHEAIEDHKEQLLYISQKERQC